MREGGCPLAALALDRKKLAAFSAAAGRFLQFPIGDRRCNRTRASVGNAGGNARPSLDKRDSSGVAPASPQVAYRALLERCIGRPPKKVGRIFGPRRGLRLPAWPRLGHNFANDLAVSIDERHSPLRFIAAERLRGRVKRRARGGVGRVGFLLSTFHVVHHSMIPLRPPHRGVIAPPLRTSVCFSGLPPKADFPILELLPPPALSERRHRGLVRRLVASARVCGLCACKRGGIRHRRGVSSLARQARDPVPNLSVKNVRVAVLRGSD